MCPSLIQIGSKTAEKNSAQTNKQTDTTKIMVTWLGTNIFVLENHVMHGLLGHHGHRPVGLLPSTQR